MKHLKKRLEKETTFDRYLDERRQSYKAKPFYVRAKVDEYYDLTNKFIKLGLSESEVERFFQLLDTVCDEDVDATCFSGSILPSLTQDQLENELKKVGIGFKDNDFYKLKNFKTAKILIEPKFCDQRKLKIKQLAAKFNLSPSMGNLFLSELKKTKKECDRPAVEYAIGLGLLQEVRV